MPQPIRTEATRTGVDGLIKGDLDPRTETPKCQVGSCRQHFSLQLNTGGDTAVADSALSTEVSRLSTRVSTLEAAMIPMQEDPSQGTNWMDYLSVNG